MWADVDLRAQHAHGHSQLQAQPVHAPEVIETIRKASLRFQNINEAIAAGYRLVGPDFPGMGEHWVNVRQVVQRDLDLASPAVLSYVKIGRDQILTGVAYTWPLRPAEAPPDFITSGIWHTHKGSIDEETLVLNPRGMTHGGNDHQLAMVHAWVWVDNPAGVFEQDNWALPFLRLGLPVPDHVPPQAGKALHLVSNGIDYYMGLIDLAGAPSVVEERKIRSAMENARTAVVSWRNANAQSNAIHASGVEQLVKVWIDMWKRIEFLSSESLWNSIKDLAY